MEIATSYLVNYTTYQPNFIVVSALVFLYVGAFVSLLVCASTIDKIIRQIATRIGLGLFILAISWSFIINTKMIENYHYYQVQEIYIHDYDISLKTYMEDYEILDSTPVSITVRSRDWKNEYPELVGKKTDFDIKTIDAENNPLGKDN